MHDEMNQMSDVSFGNDSDYDLLGYMAMKDDDPASAQAAWEEFYCRHIGYIYGALEKAHGKYLDNGSLQDLAEETLMRVYERADKFNENPDVTESTIQCRHVRGWMAKIAQNIYTDELRKQGGFRIIRPEDEIEWEQISFEVFCDAKIQDENFDELKKLKLQWIREAFQNLNEKEQYVLLVAADYEKPSQQHQRLPNKISQELAQALNTTSDGVRQIRKRAKDAIKNYVQQKETGRRVYEQSLKF
jgi:RNA polymerase sigma factor (sigma-70 family)